MKKVTKRKPVRKTVEKKKVVNRKLVRMVPNLKEKQLDVDRHQLFQTV